MPNTQFHKVLIVDDIFYNRVLLKEILEDLDCTTEQASNGLEAINKLKTSTFDIIFMDIEMPVMNGIETTKLIRQNSDTQISKTIIIAITAFEPSSFFEEYSNVGFDSLITKPYTFEKLQKTISMFF